jgi:hypothetical protein
MLQKRLPGVERHRLHCRNIRDQRISFPRTDAAFPYRLADAANSF